MYLYHKYCTGALLPCLMVLLSSVTACALNGDNKTGPPNLEDTVIMISLDGFAIEYMDTIQPPTLTRLASEGVFTAEGMIPVFPSLTFPNHYSLATGLYPEHHGIVSNTMYDPDTGKSFRIADRDAVEDPVWWGGEPIWVTAELQDQVSAVFFWVGSEAPVKGIQPTFWKRFDASVPGDDRIDQVLAWLDLPDGERPTFIGLYFGDVDHYGHQAGLSGSETAEAVMRVDGHIQRLIDGLKDRQIEDRVNLIVVSDHGMADRSPDRRLALDDYINMDDVEIINTSPVSMITPAAGKKEEIIAALSGAHPNYRVYAKENMPERYHFRDNPRIPEIIGIADAGWTVYRTRSYMEQYSDRPTGATHGYDNFDLSMRSLFIAKGPAFKSSMEVEPFENIHIYSMLTEILGLDPAPNDGDPDILRPILNN